MYTRCPGCLSAHVVNAELLAHSRGAVRCGRCDRKFDALEQLFDDWPEPTARPPTAGARYRPPVLGSKQDLNAPFGPGYIHRPPRESRKRLWLGVLLILFVVTAANVAWVYRDRFAQQPMLRALISQVGLNESRQAEPFRAPDRIRVVSRDLHTHPTRAGVLVLSATFVNDSDRAQAWPELELTLLDPNGEPVARRSFPVEDYLPGRGQEGDLLNPQVHVPVLLEFANPGNQAVGFEIRFH